MFYVFVCHKVNIHNVFFTFSESLGVFALSGSGIFRTEQAGKDQAPRTFVFLTFSFIDVGRFANVFFTFSSTCFPKQLVGKGPIYRFLEKPVKYAFYVFVFTCFLRVRLSLFFTFSSLVFLRFRFCHKVNIHNVFFYVFVNVALKLAQERAVARNIQD